MWLRSWVSGLELGRLGTSAAIGACILTVDLRTSLQAVEIALGYFQGAEKTSSSAYAPWLGHSVPLLIRTVSRRDCVVEKRLLAHPHFAPPSPPQPPPGHGCLTTGNWWLVAATGTST